MLSIIDSAGFGEWLVLLAVVLIVVGPKKLPATARKIGSYYSRFRRAAENFKRQLLDMDTEISKCGDEFARQAEEALKVEQDANAAGAATPQTATEGTEIPADVLAAEGFVSAAQEAGAAAQNAAQVAVSPQSAADVAVSPQSTAQVAEEEIKKESGV